jgi:hypothetical protein
MLSRNLLYTALTRARQAVVVVGDEAAIREAVARTRDQERVTGLPILLQAGAAREAPPLPSDEALTLPPEEAPPPNPLPTAVERGSQVSVFPSPSQWGGVRGGASPDIDDDDAAPRSDPYDSAVYDPMPDDWPDDL